jgi:iron complex transport system substrate-binding protein
MFSHFSEQARLSTLSAGPIFRRRLRDFLLCLVLLTLLAACGQDASAVTSAPTAIPTITLDAYGTPIVFPTIAPKRIISLSPSISDILGALHMENSVVGVDYYTTYPTLAKKTRVSDSYGQYSLQTLESLKPDLVISDNQLTKSYDSELNGLLGMHVVDLPSSSLETVLQKMLVVGRLVFAQSAAQTLVGQLRQQIASIKAAVAGTSAPRVMLEVDDSTSGGPTVLGGGTFADELVQDANGTNVFHADPSSYNYPQVTDANVIEVNPQIIILTEAPQLGGDPQQVYQRAGWSNIAAVKSHQVYALNINILQRSSQRLLDGLSCLAQVLHPDKFVGPMSASCFGSN